MMELTITKTVPVNYKPTRNKFPHPDGSYSLHGYGTVYAIDTDEELGPAMLSFTGQYVDSYSVNKKDWDYVSRAGGPCKYLCLKNHQTGKEYALTMAHAKEQLKRCTVLNGPYGLFYLIPEYLITGKYPM